MKSEKSNEPRNAGMAWKTAALVSAMLITGNSIQAQSNFELTPELEHEFVESGLVQLGGVDRAQPENHLQAKHGMAAFVTRDSLYLITLFPFCPLVICANECQAKRLGSHAVPLPGPQEANAPAMGLIRSTKVGSDFRTTVVVARAGGDLHRLDILTSGQTLKTVKTTTLNLREMVGLSVRAFGDVREISTALPEGFLVLGTGGLLRRVEEASTGAMTEVRLNAPTTETFTSYGNGWVGTESGQIWQVASLTRAPMMVRFQHPTLLPILRIDFLTAFLANGQYLVNRAGGWYGPFGMPGVARGAHPRFSLAGTTMRVFREQGSADTLIGDSPGYMPDAPFKELKFTGKSPMSFEAVLRDSDRNMKRPSFYLIHGDFGGDLARDFIQADPARGCDGTGTCLAGLENTLTVNLTPDSVFLSVPVLKGKGGYDNTCGRPTFEGATTVFKAVQPWWRGSTLALFVGRDTIRIQYGETVGIRASGAGGSPRIGVRGDAGVDFRASDRKGAFFDAAGRLAAPALRLRTWEPPSLPDHHPW